METLTINKIKSIKETVKQINKFRLLNKNKWYQINIIPINAKLKIFDTWIQLSTIPYFDTGMEFTPTEFKNNLTNGISKLLN